MSEFILSDDEIDMIQTCIKSHYINMIEKETEENDYIHSTDIYQIHKNYVYEAERLLGVIELLKPLKKEKLNHDN